MFRCYCVSDSSVPTWQRYICTGAKEHRCAIRKSPATTKGRRRLRRSVCLLSCLKDDEMRRRDSRLLFSYPARLAKYVIL